MKIFKCSFKLIHIIIPLITCLTTMWFTSAQRRILEGKPISDTDAAKGYMVYFIKANESERTYDAWTCGGAIISPLYILTSAACLEDVQKMYAVAETVKYFNAANLENDPCGSVSKKKIVQTCVPLGYNFSYDKIEQWSNIDIGIAQVETPYTFGQKSNEACSYSPTKIAINFKMKWQADGMDAFVMGWGHNNSWRQMDQEWDGNSNLHVTGVKVVNKSICLESYKSWGNQQPKVEMDAIITKYMICSKGASAMDDQGNFKDDDDEEKPLDNDGCTLRAPNGKCLRYKAALKEKLRQNKLAARNGICQNDHGGPLVTFVGGQQKVIAVASVFHITKDFKCDGPYLYTSTHCNQNFIKCLISNQSRRGNEDDLFSHSSENRKTLNDFCNLPPALRGFEIVVKTIDWDAPPTRTTVSRVVVKHPYPQKKINLPPIVRNPSKKTGRHTRKPRQPVRKPVSRTTLARLKKPANHNQLVIRQQIPLSNFG